MVTLGHQPRRRVEQPVRCSWTLRIARQLWLAGGAAIGTAGEWRAEGRHSLIFLCHTVPSGDVVVRQSCGKYADNFLRGPLWGKLAPIPQNYLYKI